MNLFPKSEIEQSIPSRFEKQVALYPDHLAVGGEHNEFTYRQLNQAANQVAFALLELGLKKGPVVTLCDQGLPFIAASLGIMKAGFFYVPLDPQSSPAYIQELLESLSPQAMVVENLGLKNLEDLKDLKIPIIQRGSLDNTHPVENPGIPIEPSELAYVYFTSGSTGKPKGVMDCHRNLLHNVMRYTNSLGITCEDRLSLLHAPHLSACNSSTYGALMNGASVFPNRVQADGVDSLPEWLKKEAITIYHSVPALIRFALNKTSRESKLRWIRLEGDPSFPEDLKIYQQFAPPSCRLVNGLGTTETGICRQFFFDKHSPLPEHSVPVGYSVEDMAVYTIGPNGEMQTEGPGEIAISSPYISPGYWEDPDRTWKRFLPDPKHPDQRIWKSGDLGNLLKNGCLEYRGRKPNHSEIQEKEHTPPKKEPKSSYERSIAAYWEDLFPGSEIYLESNLFELGGSSLTALRLINRIEKEYSLRLSFREVFENPSLEALVSLIEIRLGDSSLTDAGQSSVDP